MSKELDKEDGETRNPQSAIRNLSALRRFVKPRAAAPEEHCELCSAALPAEHEHLVEPATRQFVCSCQACAILFSGQAEMRYKRVPRRVRFLSDFQLTDAQWESLLIPIGMAFFFHSTPAGKVVPVYPSPAGAMESLLSLESWDDIVRDNPALREMQPDVEALLVNRVGQAREHYLVPIDECYKLVGLIRGNWRGLSGGTEVWQKIAGFFAMLKERAGVASERTHA